MSYHLLGPESFRSRFKRCGPVCNDICASMQPPEHIEKYGPACCGREMVKYRDEYCASGLASPGSDRDWCRECLMLVNWTREEAAELRRRGFLTESETDRAGMGIMASIRRRAGRDGHTRAWTELLDRMRGGIPEECPPELAGWFRQVLEHLDRDGPTPGHWPEDAAMWTRAAAAGGRGE